MTQFMSFGSRPAAGGGGVNRYLIASALTLALLASGCNLAYQALLWIPAPAPKQQSPKAKERTLRPGED